MTNIKNRKRIFSNNLAPLLTASGPSNMNITIREGLLAFNLPNEINAPSFISIKPYSSTTSKNQPVANSRKFILTLDLETRRLDNGQLQVISSAIYDGEDFTTHYLTDFANEAAMLIDVVKTLTSYNGYSLYIHNFSRFDGIFLFKYILNLSKDNYQVNFLKRDDKFIKVSISKRGDNPKEQDKFNLNIYDSYLLLPNSLRTLSQAFGVIGKISFNVLDNDTADLNDKLFRSNLLAYNQQDCKALYDVMVSFNNNIKSLFKVDITDIPTLPSLAFKL
jgi:hypothetical protein